MSFTRLLVVSSIIAKAIASAEAEPFPLAVALAEAAEGDCIDYSCHAACGRLIQASYACKNGTEYDTTCLCSSDSSFISSGLLEQCLECGWSLWSDYQPYLQPALAACGDLPTEPTGPVSVETCAATSVTSASSTAESSTAESSTAESSTAESSAAESSTAESTGSVESSSAVTYSSTAASSDASAASSDSITASSDLITASTDASTVSSDPTTSSSNPTASSSNPTSSVIPTSSVTPSLESTPGYTNQTSLVTETKQSTTLVTITSCSEDKCTEIPVTTGLTVITTTVSGTETVYTTYCPITETSSQPAKPTDELTSHSAGEPSTHSAAKPTETSSTQPTAKPTDKFTTSSLISNLTTASITTFKDSANSKFASVGLISLICLIFV